MRILIKTALALLGLAVLLVGVSFNVLRAQDLGTPRDAASRVYTSETRPVSADIDVVRLDGAIDLTLRQGATPSLVVHGEQRVLGNIVTQQEGKMLRISTKGLFVNVRKPMRVELVLPTLTQLQITGSGDGDVSGFSGESIQVSLQGSGDLRFDGQYRNVAGMLAGSGDLHLDGRGEMQAVDLKLQGSGDVSMSGATKSLMVRVQGSGDLDAAALKADSLNVAVIGSGGVVANAKSSAVVDIHGSGDVTVQGNPVSRVINRRGSGDVSFE